MTSNLTREEALELLRKYNQEPFHIQHGLTVEKTMRWFANELGYAGTSAGSRGGRGHDPLYLFPWIRDLLRCGTGT